MHFLVLFLFLMAGVSKAQVDQEVELKHERLPLGKETRILSLVDLSHYHEQFQSEVDEYEANSIQMRGKLGLKFWKGRGELLGVLGAIKQLQSQRVIQKRPYLELSLYPLLGRWGQIHQYHIIHLPFSESTYNEEWRQPSLQGTVYTIGLAPTLVSRHRTGWLAFDLKMGLDVWTRLYSRDQQLHSEQISRQDSVTLLSETGGVDDQSTWYSSGMIGVSLAPGYLRRGSLSVAAYLRNRQYPFYSLDEDSVQTQYKVERSAYIATKLKYALRADLVASNEIYVFYSGYFKSRYDELGQSLRNIFRVTLHL